MIYFVRSWKIIPETKTEAMEWIRRLAKYNNEKWPETPIELLTNNSGALNQLHWVGKFDSLGDFEEARDRFHSDEGVKAIMGERKIYFTGDVNTFYSIVEF